MQNTTEEARIQAVIEDWASGLRSKDAARVKSHGAAGMVQIVHSHESVPFYMDGSDKAAVALKPQ